MRVEDFPLNYERLSQDQFDEDILILDETTDANGDYFPNHGAATLHAIAVRAYRELYIEWQAKGKI